MNEPNPIRADKPKLDTARIKAKFEAIRKHHLVKTALIITATGIGAYLGAKKPMSQIAGDVHDMADRTKRIDANLFTFANHEMTTHTVNEHMKTEMRMDISDAIAKGDEFTYYPGLGLHFPKGHPRKTPPPATEPKKSTK